MTVKLSAGLALAAGLAAAALWSGARDGRRGQPAGPPAELPAAPAALAYRGLAIQLASGYRPLETYGPLLEEVRELGANTVLLCVAGQMEHARSQSIFVDARRVPPPEDLKAIVREARALGLHVMLMPIVLLKNPRGSEWRGVIDPPDWADWWEQYHEFVLYFADIAREAGADALLVGSELVSTEKHTDRWLALIEKCRARFWGGLLGYSANWDHYRPIQFWDRLDFVGMTSYYTLADEDLPTVEELVERWLPIRQDILDWQQRVGKPILLTEVGWCSQAGTAQAPWNYYRNQRATPEGLEEQRRLYEAFIRAWHDTPGLLGVIWWEWTPAPGGPGDFGYTPRGKPAEQVLRQWLAGQQPAPASAPGNGAGAAAPDGRPGAASRPATAGRRAAGGP